MTVPSDEIPILVTPEDLLPVINSYFEKLSELQWSMIENDALDSDVQALLADMISEIIQIASTRILRLALPQIQNQTLRGESPEDITKKIKSALGDSLLASIKSALKSTGKHAQKLSEMIEREVVDKISLAVSLITGSSNLPSDPAIYMSGGMRNVKNLRRMVSYAASCLKRCAGLLKQCCIKSGDDSSSGHSSDQSKASIEAESATHEICSILTKWRGDTDITEEHAKDDEEGEGREETQDFTETEGKAENISAPLPVEKVARDVITIILNNQNPDSDEPSLAPSSPIPACNMRLLIKKLRDFFNSTLPSTVCAKQNVCKQLFCMFVEKQFTKMRKELKEAIKKSRKYFVCLPKLPQDERKTSPESIDFSLPRSVPGTPCPEASTSSHVPSQEAPTLKSTDKPFSPVSFDNIKSAVNKLYNKLTQEGESGISKILKDIKNSEEVRDLSRQLTNKIFDLVMDNHLYKIPVPVMRRSLSESVISRTPHAVRGSERPFSSEVLYVLIEDLVEKFVQKLVLWLENQELEQTIQNDKVSGAIADIQKFIASAQTPTQEKDTESDGSEQSGRGSKSSSPSRSASVDIEKFFASVQTQTQEKDTELDELSTTEKSDFLENSSATSSHSVPISRQPSPSEKSEPGLSQVSVSSFDAARLSENLTSFLLIQIIVKSKEQQLLSSQETNMVLDRLKELVNQEISNIESAGNLKDSMHQVTKSLSKRLIKEFGSPGKVLKAAMAYDSSFDEALLRNLKIDLCVFPSPPPKKSKFARFFSALLKPFRCCCKGSDD